MRIALYGLPCAGKSTLLGSINNARIVHGSKELDRLSNGTFKMMDENEKEDIRRKYTEYIESLSDPVIISDGHYSFLDDVVFTEDDGDLYDVFFYLYCDPKTLKRRIEGSEKNRRFSPCSITILSQWQEFEIRSLRRECHKRNKDFYVISDTETETCQFKDFLKNVINGFSSFKLAESISNKIRAIFPEAKTLCIVDGDKTIILEDSFRYCCSGQTTVFDGNFYTGYQSFLFCVENAKSTFDPSLVEKLRLNELVWKSIKDVPYLVLSSGLNNVWTEIKRQKGLGEIIADPMISADTKYYVVKILRENGYTIHAYGDSKIDVDMLKEADYGTLVIGEQISSSLDGVNVGDSSLLYDHQPFILTDQFVDDFREDIAICKSDSGINGSKLASAHYRLGYHLGRLIKSKYPATNTAVLVLDRGGRFFGDGLYSGFGGVLYPMNPKTEILPVIKEKRIIIVDSVINTGRSILSIISAIKERSPEVDILIAANVIQEKAFDQLAGCKVFAVRVSKNFFIGKNQAAQTGRSGPDTADRLFNLIANPFLE